MLALGILMLLVGFVFVLPKGGASGSMAVRNIDLGLHGIHETPGYQDRDRRRGPILRVLVSLALIGGGITLVALGS